MSKTIDDILAIMDEGLKKDEPQQDSSDYMLVYGLTSVTPEKVYTKKEVK